MSINKKTLSELIINQTKNVMRIFKRIPLQRPYFVAATLDKDDLDILDSYARNKLSWYNNTTIKEYELKFAKWNGSLYAFSFMGARVALSAIIYALNLEKGDEVIIPGYTCVVVTNAFWFAGVKTKYCDIELDTYGLDLEDLKRKVTPNTKAILIHHLYGLVCRDYEKIIEYAKQKHIATIEDCAAATGACYKGQKVGNMGDCAFYSSEHTKIFTTFIGGVATTNNPVYAARIKEYSIQAPYPDENRLSKIMINIKYEYYAYKHAKSWLLKDLLLFHYSDHILPGMSQAEIEGKKPPEYGQKIPAPLAALGINQLNKIDIYNEQRRVTAKKWDQWCDKNGFRKPYVVTNSLPVFLRYPVLVPEAMKQNHRWAFELNIPIGVWFSSHIHPSNFLVENCPNADIAIKQCINFPTLNINKHTFKKI